VSSLNPNVQCQYIRTVQAAMTGAGGKTGVSGSGERRFESFLIEEIFPNIDKPCNCQTSVPVSRGNLFHGISPVSPKKDVLSVYEKKGEEQSEWQKYADDQLLSNPGGDRYYLEEKKVLDNGKGGESFWGRVSKDICDAVSNVKNVFRNVFFGAKRFYRGDGNRIKEAKQRGLVGSVCDCVKNIARAFSFGSWRSAGEVEPKGFAGKVGFMFSKMKKALFGDIVQGVGGSSVHIGEDLLLAGWNLIETMPDATIGNFKKGRDLTTSVFDNGQVVIDYITDVVPTGEAWLRVHASELSHISDIKAPVLYNLKMPERYSGDVRWRYVRNTPFRKTIETIGSLVADSFTLKRLGDLRLLSEKRREKN